MNRYGSAARDNLQGPGEPEAALSRPVGTFLQEVGQDLGLKVIAHDEVPEQDGLVRPDFGVRVNGLLCGHVELKAPGISLDPLSYSKTSHNYRQWQRLSHLPNLLHTNGIEWRLWRYGELVAGPIFLQSRDLARHHGPIAAPESLELLLSSFLRWEPLPILSVSKLVNTLAPLAVMLREEVALAITAERRAVKQGADKTHQPFLGVAQDWRALLFPQATDAEFADGFAQTVVFALVLALSDGIELNSGSLQIVAQQLDKHYSLLGRALTLLTEHIANTPTNLAVETITRALSKTRWDQIINGQQDVYLHLYEHFLGAYDAEKRKKSGSYYTPVEIVDSMVQLTDTALKQYLGRSQGLRDPHVDVLDPAMGTGTFPLSVLRKVASDAAREYGKGAASEAASNAAQRLFGIEIQSGPFSVAELRVSQALLEQGANLPIDGLNLFVADTLEDPETGSNNQLSYTLQLIAQQRHKANQIKRERNIQVVIGNPPYKDHAEGLGGWIEGGIDKKTGHAPLDAFRLEGNGRTEYVLKNLYVYFWRWATWKVFESTDEPDIRNGDSGIVSFITATGYLTGPGFKGMREYLRQTCSRIWIINVTPEGRTPPAANAIFNIETPVAIAILLRDDKARSDIPAKVQYIDVHGTREQKFAQLNVLTFDDPKWLTARSAWTAPFTPAASTGWDDYPAVDDLMPWYSPGVKPNRTWVYAPNKGTLKERLRHIVAETDMVRKAEQFKETDSTSLTITKGPLPGSDTEQNTREQFRNLVWSTDPKIVRVGYRTFDRQYLIADSRLIHRPAPPIWQARIPGQIYAVELHSEFPRRGPGLSFSALIPDMHFFRGSGGGRTLPQLHSDGTHNIAPGLVESLKAAQGEPINPDDVLFYAAAIAGHPGFVETFADELHTPGIRIPITRDHELWNRAVKLGRHVVWLHTYGERGAHPDGLTNIRGTQVGITAPSYDVAVGTTMPVGIEYAEDLKTIKLGAGRWTNITPEVRSYTVGGTNVIDSWVGYRRAKPRGKRTSPLDDLNETSWPGEWSIEFTELLSILTQLVALEPQQDRLLEDVLASPLASKSELEKLGVFWPSKPKDRRPRTVDSNHMFGIDGAGS